MNKIRKGDEVIVTTGKDKDRRGTVLEVRPDGRILVEGINTVKKHVKGNPQQGIEGGIMPRDMPIEHSNVMVFNPKTKKGERVGFSFDDDGNKIRVFKSSGEPVDL